MTLKDLLQMLEDAFPRLKAHPSLILAVFIILSGVAALFFAKGRRAQVCESLRLKLRENDDTQRWVFVYNESQKETDWKYYTSEKTGLGLSGDDFVWTLVKWPNFRTIDSFRLHGGVGRADALHESITKLQGRWQIAHNPSSVAIGVLPARGIRSKLRRCAAKFLKVLGSI